MSGNELIQKLKQQIIEALYLEDIVPEEIDADSALFEDGLGLDSIDALSLVVLLEKEYGIQVTDPEQGRAVLFSVRTIAEHILSQSSSGDS